MRPLALLFAALPLLAQEPPSIRGFLLDDYRNVACADLRALREQGIWDELEVSVLKAIFRQMEQELGFPLAALDRITAVAEPPREGGMDGVRQVVVFEGNAALDLPPRVARGRWTRDELGGTVVHRSPGPAARAELCAQPRREVLVFGPAEHLEPALQGKPHRGQPSAEVMALLSGRGENLAWFVIAVDQPLLRERVLGRLLPGIEWPEGQAPSDLLVRLRAVGEADDPRLQVEAVLRHARAGDGPAVSGKAVEQWLQQQKQEPRFRGLVPLFSRIETVVDRTDVTVRVPLGKPRDAVGYVALLAAPILKPAASPDPGGEVEAPPPPKQPGK